MKYHNNTNTPIVLSMAVGFLVTCGASSAQTFEMDPSSIKCAGVERLLEDFREDTGFERAADLLEVHSPMDDLRFQVRWLNVDLVQEPQGIEPEHADPDPAGIRVGNTPEESSVMASMDSSLATLAFARRPPEEGIEPEHADPDPAGLQATKQGLDGVDIVFFESTVASRSRNGLEGCVAWSSSLGTKDEKPSASAESGTVAPKQWFYFSLPGRSGIEGVDEKLSEREDLFRWILGLAELAHIGD